MNSIEWTYSIIYNQYQECYIVFKENLKYFISFGIFHGTHKECTEYIANLKKGN